MYENGWTNHAENENINTPVVYHIKYAVISILEK